MKTFVCILALFLVFGSQTLTFSASFQVYPGAKLLDVYEMKQPSGSGPALPGKELKPSKEIVFTTHDLFENVVAFYRGLTREYRMPGVGGSRPATLSSGQELKEAYFIFDNAADLSTSKHWVKIQRPYLGKGQSTDRLGAGRDVTAIIEEDKRTYP